MRCSILLLVIASTICVSLNAQEARPNHQGVAEIAALPTVSLRKSRDGAKQDETARSRSFYRQSTEAQTRYPYPASTPPRYGNSVLTPSQVQAGIQFQRRTPLGGESSPPQNPNLSIAESTVTRNGSEVANNRDSQLSARRPGDRFASTASPWGTTTYRQPAYQQPGYRTAQNCCTPGNGISYSPAVGFTPQAANQAPTLNPGVGTNPGAIPTGVLPTNGVAQPGFAYGQPYPGYQVGQVGVPQFGAQGARWWTPFVTGSGVYTPLVRLVPSKYGTYLGQGIIGQPTAYVDGEPIRNLLRYIFP